MKLQETITDIEVDGSFEATEMQIELSAHAYSVLSKGLYSDPYRAIVRELCCNAWDSHIEAGKTDVPFEVCLPNSMAPVFKVRDFGIGLPPEKIKTLYTYFKSTKQGSDLQTGCFGLGSKSPFAYTKKFTAISHFEGVKYHFSVHIDARGIPGTLLMAEEPTTEPNGIEVSFAVEPQDFNSFLRATVTALRPFEKKPVIRGIHGNFFSATSKPFLEGKGWKLYHSGYDRNGQHHQSCFQAATAVMGNVEYPLNAQGRSGVSKNAAALLGSALVVDFPLGAFEITPSRESIQWTEYSITNVTEKLEAVYDEIVTYVTDKIATASCLWQANIESQALVEQGPLAGLGMRPTWQGKSVKGTMHIPDDVNLMQISAEYPRRVGEQRCQNSASVCQMTQDIRPHEVKFYFADFAGSMGRISNYVRDHFTRNETCYVIVPVDEFVEDDKRYTDFKAKNPNATYCPYQPQITKRKPVHDKARLAAFVDAFGILEKDVILASSVPARPREVTERQARLVGSKARAFAFDDAGRGEASDHYWQEAEVDLAKVQEGVYVELNKWCFVNSKLAKKPTEFSSWLHKFEMAGLKLPANGLIGVKTADMKKFQSATNWITLDEYVVKKLKEAWKSPDFQLHYRVLQLCQEETYFRRLAEFKSGQEMSPEFKKLVTQISAVIDDAGKVHSYKQAVTTLRDNGFTDSAWDKELSANDSVTKELVERAMKRYPLLPALFQERHSHFRAPHKAIIQYAKLIDNEGK